MTHNNRIKMCPEGPEFSRVTQGYWRMAEWSMTPQQRLTFLKEHIELGVTTVDHAHVYGNPPCETLFGEALAIDPSIRNDIEIITKCGIVPPDTDSSIAHYNSSKRSILDSVDLSLSRFGIENVDVLLIHRPDWLMNADDIAHAFEQLKVSGKVQHFGVSNFTPSQLSLLQSRLGSSLVTNQVEINPFNMTALEDGTLDQLQEKQIVPMAWSCLAGGRLFNEDSEMAIRLRRLLQDIAEEIGATSIDQVVYAWAAKLPSRPVLISGSGKIERLKHAVDALKLQLTQQQWYRIWVAAKGHGVA
ncbi:oxidoreductase [Veronia nyctiphanis]|uniref:Oxidoreductase n=1 Tax=Veronia nyctiphanis TaxID=1278244 RepID=A0A4Q0YKE4_9GAMM|nr:aldo/keto reductase [Veronia nyctiphanis]RXJ70444.1 oxidoreductase [Veronia nyctiphanis]